MLEESLSSNTLKDKAMDIEDHQPAPPDGVHIDPEPNVATTSQAKDQGPSNQSANRSSLLDTSQQSGKRKRKRKHNRAIKTAMAQARTLTNGPSLSPIAPIETEPQQSISQVNRPVRLRQVGIPPLSMVTAPFFGSCHCCCPTRFYGPQALPTSRLVNRPVRFNKFYHHNPALGGFVQPSRYFGRDRPYAINWRKSKVPSPLPLNQGGDIANASKVSEQDKERDSLAAAHTKKCLEIDFGEPEKKSDQLKHERDVKERGIEASEVEASGSTKTRAPYKRSLVQYAQQRSRKQVPNLHSNVLRSRHKVFNDLPSSSNHGKVGPSSRGSRSRFYSTGSVVPSHHNHHYHNRRTPPYVNHQHHGGGRHGKSHFANHQNGGYRQHQGGNCRYDLRTRHNRPRPGTSRRVDKNQPPPEGDILRKEIAHAPKNDNEYLMREHYKDYASPLFTRALTHTCPDGAQTSSEDHHSSTDSEAEFLEREFAEEYELVRTQRLQSMSKDELLREVLCLEAKLEERERELFEFKERKIRESSL